jgi:hypothetical protein
MDIVGDKLDVSWPDLSEALNSLRKLGQLILDEFFAGVSVDDLRKAYGLFESAHPLWQSPMEDLRTGDQPPMIQLSAAVEEALPIEVLPLFGPSQPKMTVTDHENLTRAAASFLGFSVVVKRVIRNMQSPQDDAREYARKLPMKLFFNAELKGAIWEEEFFSDKKTAIDLDGPWPDEDMDESFFPEALVGYLLKPSSGFNGNVREAADQIHHFACHCETQDPDQAWVLRLAGKGKSECTVALREMKIARAALVARLRRAASPPLVVLNACGSSMIYPGKLGSFAEFMLQNGCRGFIGPEARIPDEVAAEFTREFYDRLLNGYSIGMALQGTKWSLLRKYRNPLGILYTFYGNPEDRIRKLPT